VVEVEDGCRIDSVYPALFYPGEETATNFSKDFGTDFAYLSTLKTTLKITSAFQDFEVKRHSTYEGLAGK
jgi:hypothetical protein